MNTVAIVIACLGGIGLIVTMIGLAVTVSPLSYVYNVVTYNMIACTCNEMSQAVSQEGIHERVLKCCSNHPEVKEPETLF